MERKIPDCYFECIRMSKLNLVQKLNQVPFGVSPSRVPMYSVFNRNSIMGDVSKSVEISM
jgi:hypothetical protein